MNISCPFLRAASRLQPLLCHTQRVSPDHDPNGTNLPYQVSPTTNLCCFGPSQNLEAEVNECRHLSSPVLARGIESIEREQLARPIGKQLDEFTAFNRVPSTELHDLCDSASGFAGAEHRAHVGDQ